MRRVVIIAIKVYLTCALISMVTGLVVFFGTGGFGERPSIELFLLMWIGPIALGLVLGSPLGLWLLWTRWE